MDTVFSADPTVQCCLSLSFFLPDSHQPKKSLGTFQTLGDGFLSASCNHLESTSALFLSLSQAHSKIQLLSDRLQLPFSCHWSKSLWISPTTNYSTSKDPPLPNKRFRKYPRFSVQAQIFSVLINLNILTFSKLRDSPGTLNYLHPLKKNPYPHTGSLYAGFNILGAILDSAWGKP